MCWFLYLIFPSVLFRRRAWIRELMVMGILWSYAFLIGLPVSITRSLVMFSIVAVCRAIDRESSALNSLGIAALLLLVANPSALFDMSFQLSFSAVLFIVILTPAFLEIYEPRNPLARYVWRVTVLSLSAQIGTTPIVLYHFSGFSTYVLLANLFVVPVMFVVVALSMSLWLTGWIPLLRGVTVSVLTWIINMLTRVLTFISELPYARVELSVSSWWQVLTIYAVVILVFLWYKEKRTHHLVQALACIAACGILGIIRGFVI
jgi:competence protein ComEC